MKTTMLTLLVLTVAVAAVRAEPNSTYTNSMRRIRSDLLERHLQCEEYKGYLKTQPEDGGNFRVVLSCSPDNLTPPSPAKRATPDPSSGFIFKSASCTLVDQNDISQGDFYRDRILVQGKTKINLVTIARQFGSSTLFHVVAATDPDGKLAVQDLWPLEGGWSSPRALKRLYVHVAVGDKGKLDVFGYAPPNADAAGFRVRIAGPYGAVNKYVEMWLEDPENQDGRFLGACSAFSGQIDLQKVLGDKPMLIRLRHASEGSGGFVGFVDYIWDGRQVAEHRYGQAELGSD